MLRVEDERERGEGRAGSLKLISADRGVLQAKRRRGWPRGRWDWDHRGWKSLDPFKLGVRGEGLRSW